MCAAAPASGTPNCLPSLPGTSRRATTHALLLEVLRPELDAHRHAAHFPLGEAEAGLLVEHRVDLHRDRLVAEELVARQLAQLGRQLLGRGDARAALRVVLAQRAR